jgi:2-polyprenyl-3-methyl-5-hydroxy-6-metoxy-1,4-benzoquinol methylase
MMNLFRSAIPFTSYPYKGETIACNLCGSHATTQICATDRRWKKLRTVACFDCGLMRTDPMPTETELNLYYQKAYRLDYQMAGKRPPKTHIVRSKRGAKDRAARLTDVLKPGAKVLDLGCGTGEFLKLAQDMGCEVTGIEPGESYASFARAEYGIHVINAPWQEAELPEGAFDVVTCHQVVEHLRDPMEALAAMAGWLKPDGRMYLSVPDMRANSKPSFERFHFAHIYGFTPETLDVAMRLNGFVPVGETWLSATTAVFQRDPALRADKVAVKDPERARRLAASYTNDSVAAYFFGGGYFRYAAHRFRKWRLDTFTPSPGISQVKAPPPATPELSGNGQQARRKAIGLPLERTRKPELEANPQ